MSQAGLKHDEGKIPAAELLFDFPILLDALEPRYRAICWALARASRGDGNPSELLDAAWEIGQNSTPALVVKIGAFGLEKYKTLGGWLLVPNAIPRYSNAGVRHALNAFGGERLDDESKLPHDFHLLWNACAVAELISRERKACQTGEG